MRASGFKLAASISLLAWTATAASAEDGDAVKFNAFGTFGLVHSSERHADFTRNSLVPSGAGGTHSWSPKVDSVLGGQVSGSFNSRLSALVQVVMEQRHDDSWDPRIEWANLKYSITPDLDVAVGRFVSPILMLTDTRRVSYSLPWIRTPQEVYELYPVTSNDGVNLLWRHRFGMVTHRLEMAYGRSDVKYKRNGLSGEARATRQLYLRSTLETGALSTSIGYSPSKLSLPAFAPLFDAFRQFGPAGEAIADRYNQDHRSTRSFTAGASYDPGTWFVMGEWAQVKIDGVLGSHWGWYASAGWRFGALAPYATWAETRPSGHRSDPGLDTDTLPPESAPVAAALNAQLNALLANVPEQNTFSLGARWDFTRSVCVKLQYDHIDRAGGNTGLLTRFRTGFRPGRSNDLIGLSLSFVL